MSFVLDLKQFSGKTLARLDLVQKKVVLDVDKGLVLSTPVDTGRARAGWNVGINNVDLEETGIDKTGQKTLAEHLQIIEREMNLGDRVYLSNNVEYITYLDRGSSDQAPHGMVEKTLQRFPGIVRKAATNAKRQKP